MNSNSLFPPIPGKLYRVKMNPGRLHFFTRLWDMVSIGSGWQVATGELVLYLKMLGGNTLCSSETRLGFWEDPSWHFEALEDPCET